MYLKTECGMCLRLCRLSISEKDIKGISDFFMGFEKMVKLILFKERTDLI